MQELEAQKQDAQDRLDEMDQQKAKLRDMLSDVRQKCQDETQMVSLTPSMAGGGGGFLWARDDLQTQG